MWQKMEQMKNILNDNKRQYNQALIHLMTSLNREKGGGSHGREYFDASDFNC